MTKKIVLLIVLFFFCLLGVLQFPELFIDQQLKYKSFELYSDQPITSSNDLEKVLDSVIINLKRSHFYQEDQIFELYFIKGTKYEKLVRLFGADYLASSQYNKHLYFGDPDFTKNKLVKGGNKYEWANLVQLISHEAVHSQMYTDYSLLGFMKTNSWINEGYCEYISYYPLKNKSSYHLDKLYSIYLESNDNWVETEFGSMTPKTYLRDRIIMEYLIDQKNIGITDIIENDKLKPEEVLQEIDLKQDK